MTYPAQGGDLPGPDGAGRAVGIKDVAAAAGVSPGTVSNVLNHPHRVQPATLERVRAVMDRLGYVRNEAARHLRAGSSRTLGLLVLDAWNPFFTEMARGVEDWTFERDWALLMANSARREDRESLYLGLFGERRMAGLLVVPHGDVGGRLAQLDARGTPSVVLDQRLDGPGRMSVSLDDVRGGELAMAHLLALGHRRVAFVGDPATVVQVRNRLAGARRAWTGSGLGGDPDVLTPDDLTLEAGLHVGRRLLEMPADVRPTAVFAASDMVAMGILHVLVRGGLRVPQDVALAGYDDNLFAQHLVVPLTSVRQPAYEMGRTAARMLAAHLGGQAVPTPQVVFQPELVVRESTAGPPG